MACSEATLLPLSITVVVEGLNVLCAEPLMLLPSPEL
jgi:hypothetical protein